MDYQHLLGLEFEQGRNDCYEIVRRLFKDNLNIELTPYARPTDWWIYGLDLYMDNFMREGFSVVDIPLHELRPYDSFLVSIPDTRCKVNVINHAAVYVGEGKILHHLVNRRSEVCLYGGIVKRYTSCIVRHKDVPQIEIPTKSIDLMTLLPEDKRRMLEEGLDYVRRTQEVL